MATATATPTTGAAPKPAVVTAKFKTLAAEFVKADAQASTAKGDFAQAKAEASRKAVEVVRAAHKESAPLQEIKKELLAAGVLKGTVSKIVTVVTALNDGTIVPGDVKTLNKAYTAVKSIAKITAAARATATSPTASPTGPAAKISGKDGLAAIVAEISKIADPDKRFEAIGDWTTRFSAEMSKLVKSTGTDDDE